MIDLGADLYSVLNPHTHTHTNTHTYTHTHTHTHTHTNFGGKYDEELLSDFIYVSYHIMCEKKTDDVPLVRGSADI